MASSTSRAKHVNGNMLIRFKSPDKEVSIISKLYNFHVSFTWQHNFITDFLDADQTCRERKKNLIAA